MTTAAIFDLDGTLFSGHVWDGLFRHHRHHRCNRLLLYGYLGLHIPLWLPYKVGLVSGGYLRLTWARHMSWVLRGMSVGEVARAFDWVADEYVMPLVYTDVVAVLREHQAQGERVVLLSGALEGLLTTIGARLGVDTVLGTRVEVQNGRYTGRSLEPVCQGEGKAARLKTYLAEQGRDVDLSASYVYADSIFDLPVLEMVGHPVAVHPDEDLAALAVQREWPILVSGDSG